MPSNSILDHYSLIVVSPFVWQWFVLVNVRPEATEPALGNNKR